MTGPVDGDSAVADILDADRRRYAAMIANDLRALDALLGDPLVYTHSDGRSDDRDQYLSRMRDGVVRYRDARPDGVVVHRHGDTAIMNGLVVLETTRDGVDRTLDNRFLSVWVRRAGAWKMVAWASTPIRR